MRTATFLKMRWVLIALVVSFKSAVKDFTKYALIECFSRPMQSKNRIEQRDKLMVHHHHQGPIGQYVKLKKSRFVFDEKTQVITSIDEDVKVKHFRFFGGDAKIHLQSVLNFRGIDIGFLAIAEEKYDRNGNQVMGMRDGKVSRSDLVWIDVKGRGQEVGSKSYPAGAESYEFCDIDDEFTQIAMDYLSTHRRGYLWDRVCRIIFHESQPIVPKNWEVI